MAFRAECPACNDAGEYDLLHCLKQTELGWQLFCELCGESLIHFSTEEKEQIFKAMQLTKEYVPDQKRQKERIEQGRRKEIDKQVRRISSRRHFRKIGSNGTAHGGGIQFVQLTSLTRRLKKLLRRLLRCAPQQRFVSEALPVGKLHERLISSVIGGRLH